MDDLVDHSLAEFMNRKVAELKPFGDVLNGWVEGRKVLEPVTERVYS